MIEETLKIITADEGKVFMRLSDSLILGNKISFDTRFDSITNYAEVDEPVEEPKEDN